MSYICCTWLRFKTFFIFIISTILYVKIFFTRSRWRNRQSGRTNKLQNTELCKFIFSSYFPFSHQFWNKPQFDVDIQRIIRKHAQFSDFCKEIWAVWTLNCEYMSELSTPRTQNSQILQQSISYRAVIMKMNNPLLANWREPQRTNSRTERCVRQIFLSSEVAWLFGIFQCWNYNTSNTRVSKTHNEFHV